MELSYALQSENVFNGNRMPISVSSPLQGGVKCKLVWSRLGFECLTSLEVSVCHLSFDIYIEWLKHSIYCYYVLVKLY